MAVVHLVLANLSDAYVPLQGDADICQNKVTKGQSEEDDGSDDCQSWNHCTGCP